VFAVDDEPVAHDIISVHAKKVPFLKLETVFLSAIEARFNRLFIFNFLFNQRN